MRGLAVRDVSFAAGGQRILEGVSITAPPGETTAIIGPSGSGKTSLLRVIAGLEEPLVGEVTFDGEDVSHVPAHRRAFGMMFQEFALFPHLDVGRNVAFGLRKRPRASRGPRVAEMLAFVGLEGFERRRVDTLSGGERQRVALARALAPEPRMLMLDEPMGSLDRALKDRLLVDLKAILVRLSIPTIYVTHDQMEAFAVADRVAVMHEGRVVREGTPRELHAEPGTEFVARFLGMRNVVDGERDVEGMVTTAIGRWLLPGQPGATRLLLRSEGVMPVEGEQAATVVTGAVVTTLFQGAHTRLTLATDAGELEFELPPANAELHTGERVTLRVPNVQELE